MVPRLFVILCFFFNDTATTEIYTLSLHDALPISTERRERIVHGVHCAARRIGGDRKSTRLNSSHITISYAVFCLKKKNNKLNELRSDQNTEHTADRLHGQLDR